VAQYVVGEVRSAAGGALTPVLADQLQRRVGQELASPRSEGAWRAATAATHRELVHAIEGGGSGVVTLDLRRLIRSVARDLGEPMPALPASVGRITIVTGDQVRGTRDAARRLERAAAVLAILAPLCFALALAAAQGWRVRALAGVGLAVAAAGVLVLLTRSLVGANVVDVLAATTADRDAASAAWSAGTSALATMAAVAIAGGLALALSAGVAARPRRRYL
jgi:hypothetical protein